MFINNFFHFGAQDKGSIKYVQIKSPSRWSLTYEDLWMGGLGGLVIVFIRLLITGWNLGCLVGLFVGRFFVWLMGWLAD